MYSVGLVKLTCAWRLRDVLLVLKTLRSPTCGLRSVKPLPVEIARISSASAWSGRRKVNGALTFHGNDALCRQIFDDEFAQNGGNLHINEGNNLEIDSLAK